MPVVHHLFPRVLQSQLVPSSFRLVCKRWMSDSRGCESQRNMKFNVCIEGNIGSGKTTFLQHFQDLRPILEVVEEPIDQWRDFGGENPLAHLYSDPKRWSFTFQSLVTLTLLKKHDHPQTKPLRVMERSLYSATYCFIENLKNSGLLADVEYNVLTGWFDFLLKQGRVSVDLIVYLQTSPQTCFERIQTRNRPEERNITLDYLNQLHELHERWLVKKSDRKLITPPVLIIDGNKGKTDVRTSFADVKSEILKAIPNVSSRLEDKEENTSTAMHLT
ncbi:deoxynucleoside kinase-like [Mya arenaria]|uniref:deoxynucleoside kinase-like n=1 Tax=Mya arenaria TaxID=6604 RepID=UPI0022E435B5|nr:deoxynucleoside kinase-like [Mya arenaria]